MDKAYFYICYDEEYNKFKNYMKASIVDADSIYENNWKIPICFFKINPPRLNSYFNHFTYDKNHYKNSEEIEFIRFYDYIRKTKLERIND